MASIGKTRGEKIVSPLISSTQQQDPMPQTIRDHRHTAAAAAAAAEMDHITDPNTRTKKLFDSLGKKPEIPANNIDSARRNE